jgi:hypothetical protein
MICSQLRSTAHDRSVPDRSTVHSPFWPAHPPRTRAEGPCRNPWCRALRRNRTTDEPRVANASPAGAPGGPPSASYRRSPVRSGARRPIHTTGLHMAEQFDGAAPWQRRPVTNGRSTRPQAGSACTCSGSDPVVDATRPSGLSLLGMSCASRLSFDPAATERVIVSGAVRCLPRRGLRQGQPADRRWRVPGWPVRAAAGVPGSGSGCGGRLCV